MLKNSPKLHFTGTACMKKCAIFSIFPKTEQIINRKSLNYFKKRVYNLIPPPIIGWSRDNYSEI